MKQKPKTAETGKEQESSSDFKRFDDGLRHLLSVPKKEIDRREEEWRRERPAEREKKKQEKKTG